MKTLIYTASSICNPQFGIQMERAIEYSKRGDEVVFCHCSGVMSACSANLYQNPAICKVCKIGFKVGLKNLPKTIRVVGFDKIADKKKPLPHDFKSVAEIKAFQYKEVDVGFSVLSVFISKTRNPNPIINTFFLDNINKMLSEAMSLVDAAEELIKTEIPDLVVFFNGRYYDTKPFLGLSIKYNINYITTENIGGVRADSEYRMVKFVNTIPHDTRQSYKNCLASWDNSTKSEEEKIALGKGFYEKRRNGVRAGDYVYTSNQIKGKLPDSYDPKKKNVVVYCSSEDEFSSVSAEVDSYFIFSSQYAAIKYMAENIKDEDYHFYVRIHPNMKGLDVEYHHNLYKLSAYDNVTVIAPEDPVSSYTLMDIAYNVVLFGSTIGAESLYWGKSVILLGDADYYFWGVCSIPRKHEELIEMVKEPQIYPQANEIAIKYGYYFLENSLAEKAKYINITPKKVWLLGRSVYIFDYLKFFRSSLIYRYIYIFYTRVLTRFYKNGISIQG